MAISRFTRNGDARIHYLDSGGDDRGAPIVLVPGMTASPTTTPKYCHSSGAGPSSSKSEATDEAATHLAGYDLATLSDDVGAVVDAVTAGPVHVMTFSRGTSCAVGWTL